VENSYEECEDELLDASQEEYQYVKPCEVRQENILILKEDCIETN
jgi:hypothetical protein